MCKRLSNFDVVVVVFGYPYRIFFVLVCRLLQSSIVFFSTLLFIYLFGVYNCIFVMYTVYKISIVDMVLYDMQV